MITTAKQFPVQWQETFGPASFYSWAARDFAATLLWFHNFSNPRDEDALRAERCIQDNIPIGRRSRVLSTSNPKSGEELDSDPVIVKFRSICNAVTDEWSRRQIGMLSSAADRYAMLTAGKTEDARRYNEVMKQFTNGKVGISNPEVEELARIIPSIPRGVPEIYDLAYRIYMAYRGRNSENRKPYLQLFRNVVDRFTVGAEQIYRLGDLMIENIRKCHIYTACGEDIVYEESLDLDGSPLGTVGDFEPLDHDNSQLADSLALVSDAMPHAEAFEVLLGKYEKSGRSVATQASKLRDALRGFVGDTIGSYYFLNAPALFALRALVSTAGVVERGFLEGVINKLDQLKSARWLTVSDQHMDGLQAMPSGTWLSENERTQIGEAIDEFQTAMTN